MALPNLTIKLQNGALGRVAQTSDGVAGLILTGSAVAGKLELGRVNLISSVRDLTTLGVTKENNPLVYKEVNQFYAKAGDGAELYLLVVSEEYTLAEMCDGKDILDEEGENVVGKEESSLRKLIDFAKGRIRLVGLNRSLQAAPSNVAKGIDEDVIEAAASAQAIAESYAAQINPFRLFVPALGWTGSTENLYEPRQASYNRVGFVLAADEAAAVGASAAIGQVVGTASSIPVNYSLGRVKNGAAATEGYMTNGETPEACAAMLDRLHDAGYIFYRSFVGKNGYYFNDDAMAAPLSDDYSNLNLGRVIDKAIILAYTAYIDEIMDSVEVDADGNIPQSLCVYFEGIMDHAVASAMRDEISSFTTFIDPNQNILSTSLMTVNCKIVPKGVLREININLGFENPANQ